MAELFDPARNSGGNAMDALDMAGVVEAMQKRLLARVNLADADYADVVEGRLEQEALAAFAADLRRTPQADTLAWLVRRVAQLEARVGALTRALYQIDSEAEPLAAPPRPPAGLDRSVVVMDETVAQEGFHYAERTSDGPCYRWLGPAPTARVYLPKVGLPVELTLHVASVYKGVDLAAVRLAFNDGPPTRAEIDRGAGGTVLRCRPVAGPGGDGLLHYVDIDCGATFRPADEGGSDTRRLGIALSRIEIARVS